jgi:hypothetical protein
MKRLNMIYLVVALLLASCNIPAETAPAPVTVTADVMPTALDTATPEPTAVPLTPDGGVDELDLINGTYRLPVSGREVTLFQGKYEQGSGSDYLLATLLPMLAFGDLDGDGIEDAAVLIGENGGGSGTFVSLFAIRSQAGAAVQVGALLIDDRPHMDSILIQDGKIIVTGLIHGPQDSMVSPTMQVQEVFAWSEAAGLNLVRLSTPRGDGWTLIEISAPTSGSEVGGSVQVRGSMPITPFENNLRLRIYNLDGNVLQEGPFAVQAADIGQPGTFDNSVDLSGIPTGTVVRLELSEISMKDGSVVALESIILTLRYMRRRGCSAALV